MSVRKTILAVDSSLQQIKIDDRASLEQIYKQYWSKLYIYAFNVLHEKEICEDIIQEIFVGLWMKRNDIQISNLDSYLYQSVKYQIFNHFRRSKYKRQLMERFNEESRKYKIDETYEKKELKVHIKDAISKLPEQRRLIFQMSRYEGLSNKEISENLNISLQTVKNQISASLKFIRKSLNNFYILFF
ncbi:MAG: RNA polymerase sigma-70 factor [Ignavibacteriaceae bacterium]